MRKKAVMDSAQEMAQRVKGLRWYLEYIPTHLKNGNLEEAQYYLRYAKVMLPNVPESHPDHAELTRLYYSTAKTLLAN